MKACAVGCAGEGWRDIPGIAELLVQHAGPDPNWRKEPLASGTWGGPLPSSVYSQSLN